LRIEIIGASANDSGRLRRANGLCEYSRVLLCVPTLCRYDLLRRLIRSAELGSLRPSGYVIIDNGGGLDADVITSGTTAHDVTVLGQTTNLGVAASWNRFLDIGEPVVVSNDDIAFRHDTFQTIVTALESYDFVAGFGWALFGQTPACTARVGFYDENFWPAYYEDSDYDMRMRRAGLPRKCFAAGALADHAGWSTSVALPDAGWLQTARSTNYAYFVKKWGGVPPANDEPADALYAVPFDGHAPAGWTGRPITRPAA
jgi:GT2 family glycosyltransferase